ncbi:hypothetical protein Tco_1025880, partial [Tanacetum coccineum]
MPDDVKAYLDKAQKLYGVDNDEYRAARAWREVLEYKGLPLDTPYKYKTYSDRIAEESESEDEDYIDSVYEKVYGKKRRQLDAEALRKQKLRKPKRYKRYSDLVYADEDSKKKRDNKIKAHKERRMQSFCSFADANSVTFVLLLYHDDPVAKLLIATSLLGLVQDQH